jgi:hypothetical protein
MTSANIRMKRPRMQMNNEAKMITLLSLGFISDADSFWRSDFSLFLLEWLSLVLQN